MSKINITEDFGSNNFPSLLSDEEICQMIKDSKLEDSIKKESSGKKEKIGYFVPNPFDDGHGDRILVL